MQRMIAAAAVLALLPAAYAQVTITSSDMFNAIGQYYRYYSNPQPNPPASGGDTTGGGNTPPVMAQAAQPPGSNDADVTGLIGPAGGPQSWDFTTGPTNVIFRFDYVSPDDGGHGGDFPKARFAERRTDEATGTNAWLYLDQIPGTGRFNYGFYDENFSPDQPSTPFSVPLLDFPDPINYKDTWTGSTTFNTQIIGIAALIKYSATATADAYGIINLPGIGFGECLRVNEVATYETQADIFGDGNFQDVSTDYVRTYYWLRPNHGIVAEIASDQQPSPPPENFTSALQFARMFELSHPVTNQPAATIKGLRVTLGKDQLLINWTKSGTITNYTVQFTPALGGTNAWQVLTNTTSNFALDGPTSSNRFYRIVGTH